MNLIADENVDAAIVDRLRAEGHAVVWVADLAPGVTDQDVLRKANASTAILVTADKDFGELVFRQGLAHSGVMLIRLAGVARGRKAEIVAEVLRERAVDMHRGFTVVTPGQVRIRRPV